jgi:hypothetical protein
MSEQKKKNFWVIIAIILLAALSRLLPHPGNFTPLVAMALFGGAYMLNKKHALIFVLAALFLSDIILNNTFHRAYYPDVEGFVFFSKYMITVYGSMALIVGLAILFLKKISMPRVLLTAMGASILFYFITNFGSMVYDPIYTKDFKGLVASLTAGLPFFKNALVGNLIYSTVIFGAYEFGWKWYQKRSFAS